MYRYPKRRYKKNSLLRKFLFNASAQYSTTIVSAILLAGFVFSGFLLFRYTDTDDLLMRGKRLMSEGKVALAAKTFQALVSRHKDNYDGHLLLGQAYLELGEREKAEEEFKTASALRSGNVEDPAASIAMSKFAIARKEFEPAEKKLLEMIHKRPNDPEVREALYQLYDSWGDTLINEQQDYEMGIARYERALRYVREYRLEDKLKEKLIEAISTYNDKLNTDKKFDEAVQVLKLSLRYRYLPDTLVAIGEAYEKGDKLDDAIEWYRKAFEASPNTISIKLSNLLIKKGRELLDDKQPEEAEKYFNEARKVNETANIPMEVLFPVKIEAVKVKSTVDEDTGEFMPQVSIKFVNGAQRPLNFLKTKVTYYSGSETLAEVERIVARPDDPLAPKGEECSERLLNITPEDQLNLSMLKNHRIRVKVSIAYIESKSPLWKDVALQETDVRDKSAMKDEADDKIEKAQR